jgi:quinol-cytochrome oxidoreductase complex cytochrome b subunit
MQPHNARRPVWPFAFAIFLATLVSFPAWATLDLIAADAAVKTLGTGAFFVCAATALVLYVRWCLHRDCRRAQVPTRDH